LTSGKPALRRARVLRAVVLVLVTLVCGAASAQQRMPLVLPMPMPTGAAERARPEPGRAARVAAISGVVGAGLMIAGTLAIELSDHRESEAITRGIHLGFTAIAGPIVALTSFMVRRRGGSEGSLPMRTLGWAFYTSAIAFGVAQWYAALHDQPIRPGLGYLYGTFAVLSLLPQSFDAYLVARVARARARVWVRATPAGVVGTF
jgi:hypothetical protein